MIEQIAHSSAEALRIGTTADVEAGIADLHVRQARHRRHTTLAAVAAVAKARHALPDCARLVVGRDAGQRRVPPNTVTTSLL